MTYSNQLATCETAVPVLLQPTDLKVDDLVAMSRLCFVVPVVDKELEFEQAGMESLLQTVAFRYMSCAVRLSLLHATTMEGSKTWRRTRAVYCVQMGGLSAPLENGCQRHWRRPE